jgi:hypothetical protein
VVIWSGRKFYRKKRSRIFKRPTRINPRHSRRGYRRYRRNPLSLPRLPLGLDSTLMTALPVVGGVALAMIGMGQLEKLLPAQAKQYGKFYGVAHVALGVAAMLFVKKDIVRTLGGTMVAMGLYDLIACNVKALNLPALPGRSAAVLSADMIVGASFNAPAIGTDYAPAVMGASYGASYGDDIDYGGDSIEIG